MESRLMLIALTCILTILTYQSFVKLQAKLNKVWLNPMLLTILFLILGLYNFQIDYEFYDNNTEPLNFLLELSVVTLGFPLYQQLHAMKKQWKVIVLLLILASLLAIISSFALTWIIISQQEIAISLSLKSITTPIAIAITEQLNGNIAVTAFTIIIAGLFGAIWGIKWLTLLGVNSANAQGLAIGTASHALGTATISQISYQHAAYSSLALILSASVTAIIGPVLIPIMINLIGG
ncbi:LrgB family protein [Thalassotalea profundi]|uniref:CidB/LrgB family autolysis modulator n=1 Tax=Thalassotalea profundi TaxID=2036687 RepID=A0ABQ3IHW6_9GAMM|nr:LrgB family protein [Thalassotalea profundi]GHE81224.1 CidB/LrgB family autolysis modulator [Thalassotalea profundi]